MTQTKILIFKVFHFLKKSKIAKVIFCLLLSWFYAFCSQIIIPLPFNFVPISLQPLPIFISTYLIGWPAVFAYFLTIFQAVLGAPFFSGFEGGILKLIGPTGGYIFGFLFAMLFLVLVRNIGKNSIFINIIKFACAHSIMFIFGLLQLSFFVSTNKLLLLGLYPFIFGDILKIIIAVLAIPNKR